MKLREISSSDELVQELATEMLEENPVLRDAEFYSISGDADQTRKPSLQDGGAFRAKDNNYAGKVSSPSFEPAALTIFGDKISTDRANERRGKDVKSVHAYELAAFARNMGKNIVDQIFNADGIGNAFAGIKTQNQVTIDNGTDGSIFPVGNADANKAAQQDFYEKLYLLINKVKPNALYMNDAVQARIAAVWKEFSHWVADEFGQPFPYFNKIKLISPGVNGANNDIIPLDEVLGGSSDCTSIYAVRWGEAKGFSLATSNGLNANSHGFVDNFLASTVEMDLDAVLIDDNAIGRLPGVRLAQS